VERLIAALKDHESSFAGPLPALGEIGDGRAVER